MKEHDNGGGSSEGGVLRACGVDGSLSLPDRTLLNDVMMLFQYSIMLSLRNTTSTHT